MDLAEKARLAMEQAEKKKGKSKEGVGENSKVVKKTSQGSKKTPSEKSPSESKETTPDDDFLSDNTFFENSDIPQEPDVDYSILKSNLDISRGLYAMINLKSDRNSTKNGLNQKVKNQLLTPQGFSLFLKNLSIFLDKV